MTSYLRNSKIARLTHIFSFVLLSIAAKNPRTLVITFGKLSVFYKTHKHGRMARGGGASGAAAPPNFGQLRFFGQQEKIWAKPVFKNVSMFINYFEDLNINLKSA